MTHVITKDTIVLYSKSGHFEVHQIPSATDNVIWFVVWTENANKFYYTHIDQQHFEGFWCNRSQIEEE